MDNIGELLAEFDPQLGELYHFVSEVMQENHTEMWSELNILAERVMKVGELALNTVTFVKNVKDKTELDRMMLANSYAMSEQLTLLSNVPKSLIEFMQLSALQVYKQALVRLLASKMQSAEIYTCPQSEIPEFIDTVPAGACRCFDSRSEEVKKEEYEELRTLLRKLNGDAPLPSDEFEAREKQLSMTNAVMPLSRDEVEYEHKLSAARLLLAHMAITGKIGTEKATSEEIHKKAAELIRMYPEIKDTVPPTTLVV